MDTLIQTLGVDASSAEPVEADRVSHHQCHLFDGNLDRDLVVRTLLIAVEEAAVVVIVAMVWFPLRLCP